MQIMSTHRLPTGALLNGSFPVSIRICDPPVVDLDGDDSRTTPDRGAVIYARDASAAAVMLADLSWSVGQQSIFREVIAGLGFDPNLIDSDEQLRDALFDVRIDEDFTVGFRPSPVAHPDTEPFTALLHLRYQGVRVGDAYRQLSGVLSPTWAAHVLELLDTEPTHRSTSSRKRS
jgi:hypothetical protein